MAITVEFAVVEVVVVEVVVVETLKRSSSTCDREYDTFVLSHLSPPSRNHMIIVDFLVDLRLASYDTVLTFYHHPLAPQPQTRPITRRNALSTTEKGKRHTRGFETHLYRAQVCFSKSFFFST